MNQELLTEKEVATLLNVSESRVRRLRSAVHQKLVKSGKVFLWPVEVIQELWGHSELLTGLKPRVEKLRVVSKPNHAIGGRHVPNPRLIRAQRANGELVWVRVRHPEKWMPVMRDGRPMEFLAIESESNGVWLCVQREPRFPGMF